MSKTKTIPQQNPGEDGQKMGKVCGNEQDQKNSATKPRERGLEKRNNLRKWARPKQFRNKTPEKTARRWEKFAEMSKTRRIPQQNPGEDGQRKEKTCGNEQKLKVSAINP